VIDVIEPDGGSVPIADFGGELVGLLLRLGWIALVICKHLNPIHLTNHRNQPSDSHEIYVTKQYFSGLFDLNFAPNSECRLRNQCIFYLISITLHT
jgi:hypothetical protein